MGACSREALEICEKLIRLSSFCPRSQLISCLELLLWRGSLYN